MLELDWVAVATFATLVIAQSIGAVLYIERGKRETLRAANEELTRAEARIDATARVERAERQREFDRIERAMEDFNRTSTAAAGGIARVEQSVDHLSQRIADNAKLADRDIDEVKHSVRNIHQKVDAISVISFSQQAKGVRASRGSSVG